MLAWKLWRALNNPPRHHPLFQYTLAKAKKEQPKVTSGFFMWAFMCSSLTFFWTIVIDWVPYLLLAILILFNTVYSIRWVLRISHTIAKEKEQRRYDLLASLPSGLLGTSWAVSTGCVHRRSSFRWLPYLILLGVSSVTCMLTLYLSITVAILNKQDFSGQDILGNLNLMQFGIIGVALMVIFYFDHIYSILTAFLLGQLVTVDLKSAVEAQIRAFIGFLQLQLLVYAITYIVMMYFVPKIFTAIAMDGIGVYVTQAIIGVALYLFLREVQVKIMWKLLHRLFLADHKEIALVLEPPHILEGILADGEVRVPQPIDNL